MYSELAKQQRKCLGMTKNGQPCKAFACWDSKEQLCNVHCGRHHKGRMPYPPAYRTRVRKNGYKPCTCIAYQWPHRPASGLCEWPNLQPKYRCTIPAGTHAFIRRPKNYSY